MKITAVLFIISCTLHIIVSDQYTTNKKYTTKYDGIHIEQLFKSNRLMESYVKCLLDKGRCSPDGHELKRVLPDALKTNCAHCSFGQKYASRKIINFLIDKKKAWWDQLEAKFDPSGNYRKRYMRELKN